MFEEELVSVGSLWDRLLSMEAEKRFDGRPYPAGMSSFPFRLKGQGFFPGGDGLWREDDQLAQASSGMVPLGGIIFLGYDFGTVRSFEKLRKKGYENPLTWKHVKQRVKRADLASSVMFFTNAVMGLRDAGTALEKKNWDATPKFRAFCGEFLVYQVEITKPRLVVVMGPDSRKTVECLAVGKTVAPGRFPKMQIGNQLVTVYFSTHPYGDFNFDDGRKNRDAIELRDAWERAQS